MKAGRVIRYSDGVWAPNLQSSAAKKTRFTTRYASAARLTEDSRLLYLLIKILKNRPPASVQSPSKNRPPASVQSPSKQGITIKSLYKKFLDRVLDDPILSTLDLPLPNINNKSVSTFLRNEEKKANYRATSRPKVKPHKQVLSDVPLPEASQLPSKRTATWEEVQYTTIAHVSGRRQSEKRRLDFVASTSGENTSTPTSASGATPVPVKLRPIQPTDRAPILLVVPAQPQGQTVSINQRLGQVFIQQTPAAAQTATRPVASGKTGKPCGT
ncbi:hypothetical protein DPMN_132668 [Dreissena polymorpha]|uniref:Uncharacterized protein n=1 Tax=Dreissena polymorpha TaxID=45954 RepID=A0A9D4FSW5_DREPO|nr:hypothetical protein DPMN_132668 [Dreissena polymorpha]